MPAVTYAKPITVHTDRKGGKRNYPILWFVLHTSEGSEGDNSAEALAGFMTRPGDRPSPSRPGGFFGSSYQYVTDTGMAAIPCTPETEISYSAGTTGNRHGVHICLPGKADQTREQWLDGISRQYIRCAAAIMVDRGGALGIPLTRLSLDDLKAKRKGYCDHDDIADSYHETDHYDLGPNFPWDVLAADIKSLSDPTEPELGMALTTFDPAPRIAQPFTIVAGQDVEIPIRDGDDGKPAHSAIVCVTVGQQSEAGHLQILGADTPSSSSQGNWDGPHQTRACPWLAKVVNGKIRIRISHGTATAFVDLAGVVT